MSEATLADPVVYYRGRFAGPGPTADELRASDRLDDIEATTPGSAK